MFSFVMRQPFAILGAIGLLSVLKSFLTFHEDIAAIINAYQVVTRGVWDFLFGWLYIYIPISVPGWAKDYFTMALICFGAMSRLAERKNLETILVSCTLCLVWPILFLWCLITLSPGDVGYLASSLLQPALKKKFRKIHNENKDKELLDELEYENTNYYKTNMEKKKEYLNDVFDEYEYLATEDKFCLEYQRSNLSDVHIISRKIAYRLLEFTLWAIAITCTSYILFFADSIK